VRHLIFDLDGTLVDSAPDLAVAVNALLAELGKPSLTEAVVRPMIGDGARLLLARALAASGAEAPPSVYERFMEHYLAHVADRTRPYPDVLPTLEALRARGHPMGICTNKPFEATTRVLAAFGLSGFFGVVIGGDSLPKRKPDPEPLLAAIAGLGGTAASAVMIGDSANDVLCARAAAVTAILIPSDYGNPAEDADLKLARFAELPAAIAQL
jgi:phosphoglycolate phosphatase